ncbi:hypothetical protein GGR50DRAFT_699061 [Xylaria sp. CBS 124048]|nr:hypothetical protein GGR50DRAFT_699061 [Xylaria sp. CBS 124048]
MSPRLCNFVALQRRHRLAIWQCCHGSVASIQLCNLATSSQIPLRCYGFNYLVAASLLSYVTLLLRPRLCHGVTASLQLVTASPRYRSLATAVSRLLCVVTILDYLATIE